MREESHGKDGMILHSPTKCISFPFSIPDAEFRVEFRPGRSEDDEGEVEVTPLRNKDLLPDFLHETIVFDESQTPMFLAKLIEALSGEGEAVEDESRA